MFPKYILISLLLLFISQNEIISQKFDAEVVKYTTLCEVIEDKFVQIDTVAIQINNRVGDKYTEIEIPYSKLVKVSNIDAWMENNEGTKIRALKKSDIIEKSVVSNISLYEDDFKKCFQLRYNLYPYKIIYTYKTISNFISFKWSPIVEYDIPTRYGNVKIVIPKTFKYKYFANHIPKLAVGSNNNNSSLEWTVSYDKPFKAEIYSQPQDSMPYVIFSPLYFHYGVEGCSKDWESFGNWQYKLIEGLDNLPDEEKQKIMELISGVSDKKEIIKILYHYMQDNTRYINVSIDIGGLKPYPASYVAQNKYGDCKALTNYMKALLKFAGIESYYTTVYAGEQPRNLIHNYAGQQFNHVVLAVPINNDTIWLENTDNTNPFGYMGIFTQNREALLVTKDSSELVRIPALKRYGNLVSSKIVFDLNINGNTNTILKLSLKGKGFETLNQIQSEFNNDEKNRIVREYIFQKCEVVDWKIKKIHRDTARLELNATLNFYKMLNPLGSEYYFSLYPTGLPNFSIPSNRNLPVKLPYPIYNIDTLTYKLPDGYELKTIPNNYELKNKYGNYNLNFNTLNRSIQIIKKFELFSAIISKDEYPEFYNFIKAVKDIDTKKLIIKPTE